VIHCFRLALSRRVAAIVLGVCAAVSTGAQAGGSHLYVMLGLGGMSPGLSEFGESIGQRGIPTTVGSYIDWAVFAQEAIDDYKSGRVSSIMIVGHSLGGGAARAMAAQLAQEQVPVKLLIVLDPVGDTESAGNVQRSVTILPGEGEDHFSMIEAHRSELEGYVLGIRIPRHVRAREPQAAPNFSYGSIN